MSLKRIIHFVIVVCSVVTFQTRFSTAAETGESSASPGPASPNIVLFFTDDQGYGDVGCFGATSFSTPNLDQLAESGKKFTSFYVSQAVCGASRASLLTGCYANRIGMLGAPGPNATHGINDSEVTLAELCKSKGYRTCCVGKWHLGHHEKFLPLQHGFDEYLGLPYSNDMWPFHPTSREFPPLPLIEGNKVIDTNVTGDTQATLASLYTKRAVDFIRKNPSDPFFLYVAHSMPHVPLFGAKEFEGKSKQGRYGDVIQEIDWSMGEIVKALEEAGVRENTLILFCTDNGPWLSYGNHSGSAGPLREGKGTAWEGGVRVPCIMSWPAKIQAKTKTDEVAATIDVLPTIAEILGAELPHHKIDGLSLLPLMTGGEEVKSARQYYFYFYDRGLHAVRSGDWKLVFPHKYRSLESEGGIDGKPANYIQRECGLELYNLKDDIGETKNLIAAHPDVVARLQGYAELARADLGDAFQKRTGNGLRNPGKLTE